ncbi:MAG: VTT domain-containing protein [Planctomycetota bacterium]|nr:VTT domain-containing protein [Planctomycetota bacterium]
MTDLFHEFLRLFQDLPGFLGEIVSNHGVWVYALLFAIVFVETGIVIMPFLPGDSLLFAVGALSAELPGLRLDLAMILLWSAAILGDNLNWFIGRKVGPRAFSGTIPILNAGHLVKTQKFFEKHGARAVILARFVPIVRTCAPFVAGVGSMRWRTFFLSSVVGTTCWVGLFCLAGRLFGNVPIVRKNFTIVIGAIIVVSLLPLVIEWWRVRSSKQTPEIDGR